MWKSARQHNVISRLDETRTEIVRAIIDVLAALNSTHAGVDEILNRCGYSQSDIRSVFESIDDLIVEIAQHQSFLMSRPLATARRETLEDVRDTLISFGRIARKEYSTTVVGLFRMMMTQSTHSPLLKKRVFQAGPAAVTMQLRSFLSEASERGVLSIPDTQLYAEQLMGVLREPLYQALTLRPEISPDEPSIDHITAGIDLFLKGCANQGRTTP